MPRLHSAAAIDRPEISNVTLPPILEVVWQQPQETYITNVHKTLTTETQKNTNMLEFTQRNDVESQTLRMKETSPQVSGSNTEPVLESQTGSTQVQGLNDSKEPQSEIQQYEMNIIANDSGDDNISLPK